MESLSFPVIEKRDYLVNGALLTLPFLLQININEMNKLKNEMVRDEVIMNNRMEWS